LRGGKPNLSSPELVDLGVLRGKVQVGRAYIGAHRFVHGGLRRFELNDITHPLLVSP
jgi:hypothetical protein